MIGPPPIPEDLWAKVPPDAQAALAAVFLATRQRVYELQTRVGDLEARLKLNSTHSSRPPSADSIGRFGWTGGFGTRAHTEPAERLIGILFTRRMIGAPDLPKVFTDLGTLAYGAEES